MQKNAPPDSLPSAPFAGDLSVIVMRELPGTVVATCRRDLRMAGPTALEWTAKDFLPDEDVAVLFIP